MRRMLLRRDPLADPEPLLRRVYAYVAFRIGHGPDAEDVTSDTLERALRYRRSYDASKGEPVAWLLGIARRCVDDFLAARRPVPLEPEEEASAENLEEEAVERLRVAAVVAGLDDRDRELIALHYGADLAPRRIAEVLGLRPNAVEVALHRARARLRARLEGDEADAVETPEAVSL